MAAALTLLLPLYCYTYSTLLLSTYYYYLLLLATNCWLLLLFLPNLPGLAQDLLSCLLPSAAALCLLSSYWFFFAKSPLSSPLLCFVDDEIVQVHTLYGIWANDQELVRNMASLAAAPTLPSPLLSSLLWCLDAPSSRSDDDWHVSEASTTAATHFYILLFYRTTLVYRPFWFLIPSRVSKAHFLASIRTKCEIMSRTPDSVARCPEHDEHPTYEEQALEN